MTLLYLYSQTLIIETFDEVTNKGRIYRDSHSVLNEV